MQRNVDKYLQYIHSKIKTFLAPIQLNKQSITILWRSPHFSPSTGSRLLNSMFITPLVSCWVNHIICMTTEFAYFNNVLLSCAHFGTWVFLYSSAVLHDITFLRYSCYLQLQLILCIVLCICTHTCALCMMISHYIYPC